jgi:LmbE family N-acetylglucosaminyl deacetylase
VASPSAFEVDKPGHALVVSPHLDDAVLSAAHRIRPGATTVVTVFAGTPGPSIGVTSWDAYTGAADSATRMRERHGEDDEAMRRLGGVPAIRLDFLDSQYRETTEVDDAAVASTLADMIESDIDIDAVWLPAGIGGHPDHVATRIAGLTAVADFEHLAVYLYADFPYVVTFGWPAWAVDGAATPYLDGAAFLDAQLRAQGLAGMPLQREIIQADDVAAKRKRHAIEAYRSQLPGLRLHPATLDADPDLLRVELAWRFVR